MGKNLEYCLCSKVVINCEILYGKILFLLKILGTEAKDTLHLPPCIPAVPLTF